MNWLQEDFEAPDLMIANGRGQLCKLFSSEIASENGTICDFDRREGLDRKQSVEVGG